MQEKTEQEITQLVMEGEAQSFAVFLYTPFCGTCKLTERMLDIVVTMLPDLPLYKGNVNYLPRVVRDWQISSVPCILFKQREQDMEFLYRMNSVDELYQKLKLLI
ncbi:thioredoxin family protein [Paenibacillus hexagrammi]|uniref:Thioredoxin family protein n=1 Tax=Paenibacillus hexagrammi TaxID=2908839 RepID=A0ABY3SQ20_9BACL|nr:thioredoxin family protein [Paenibacillus sp. YPD9-1]UJF35942.1 thioredoxin family protein [Paenibacillus sp. YPD9-1]